MRAASLLFVLLLVALASPVAAQDDPPPEGAPPEEAAAEEAAPGETTETTETTETMDPSQREAALEPIREAHRSAKAAVAMTMVFPGWGQFYADSPFWGIVGFGVQMYYLGNILLEARRVERQRIEREKLPEGSNERLARDALVEEHKERVRDFLWWSAGGFLILSLDAFVSVELADFDSGEPPTPDLDREWEQPGSSGDGVALRLNFSF